MLCVKWCGFPFNKIFTAGIDGNIHWYDLNLREEGKTIESVHSQNIMDLLPIPSLSYLVSCAMDGKVALWNISFVE